MDVERAAGALRGVGAKKNPAIAGDSGGARPRRTDLHDMPGYIRPEDRIETHKPVKGGHPLGAKTCRCLWAVNRDTGRSRIVAASPSCEFHGRLEVL